MQCCRFAKNKCLAHKVQIQVQIHVDGQRDGLIEDNNKGNERLPTQVQGHEISFNFQMLDPVLVVRGDTLGGGV